MKEFAEGELIVPYLGEYISDNEYRRRYGSAKAASAIPLKTEIIDSACARGLGAYANTGNTTAAVNARYGDERSTEFGGIWVTAIKRIAPGAEIIVPDYWNGGRPPHETLKRKFRQARTYPPDMAEEDAGDPSAFRPDHAATFTSKGNKVKLRNVMDVYNTKRDVLSDYVQHVREHPDARYAPAHQARYLVGVIRPKATRTR